MPIRSILAAVLVAIIWGLNFVVIDVGLEGMPPTLFLALRFMVVIVPAIFFVPRPKSRFRDVVLIGSFMSLGQFGLLYTALAIGMPPGLASLVLQAQVVLTVVFAALALRETPTRSQLVGVVLGAAGLVVVGSGRGVETPVLAFFVTLAAAASWAIGNVIARRVGRIGTTSSPLAGLSLTVWSALVVPIPMLGLAFAINGADAVGFALTHLTVPQLLSTAYTAWLASLVGYGIWNTLLARHAASAVVPFTMLVPPIGMTTAWLALGEVPTVIEVIGGVMLLLGVAITTGLLRRRRGRALT
ncbi:EamA family transporter [Salinibacterium sp. NSLL150]|uniref:EamA family transporter n=1 Tax=unclassified Salinibacterium TaxID=2632331 RepID=UPI0018CC876C|nr:MULTISPECIES: EamA family transporter [unclassified Salinibacterium]MBH0098033.1 EamA family transporter [Salinibacterium sp. NSLL35]MBH0100788.1 EamA family transporter [Salinibacterium sp. NSLL150]MBH0103547.1 EamA family transporter [Salinibacterium sp. NSLL16]MBH0106308.1 EamA family transporter [Salinibacterium sp. NSLL17]MBH0130156.1 EamA family transporter [Salinibacterium sp. NK8237]